MEHGCRLSVSDDEEGSVAGSVGSRERSVVEGGGGDTEGRAHEVGARSGARGPQLHAPRLPTRQPHRQPQRTTAATAAAAAVTQRARPSQLIHTLPAKQNNLKPSLFPTQNSVTNKPTPVPNHTRTLLVTYKTETCVTKVITL